MLSHLVDMVIDASWKRINQLRNIKLNHIQCISILFYVKFNLIKVNQLKNITKYSVAVYVFVT